MIQVNDSTVIVSALYSLLVDSSGTELDKIMDCYPTIKYATTFCSILPRKFYRMIASADELANFAGL